MLEREDTCQRLLSDYVGRHFGYRFVSCHLTQPLDSPGKIVVRAVVQGPRLLEPSVVRGWELALAESLSKPGDKREVSLEVECQLGGVVFPETDAVPAKIRQKLQELADAKGGRVLEASIHLQDGTYQVFCQVLLPSGGENTIATEWAASLRRVAKSEVVLKTEILTGRVFRSE